MPTLFLSKKDIISLLNMKEVIEALENVFRESLQGKTSMPHKSYLTLENGDFRAMPALIPGAAGIKWVNVHPGNANLNLPTVMAVIIYNDPSTGYPLAIMDATDITAYRTGATSAIASKYLASNHVHTLGISGVGRQAYTQLLAHLELFELKEIRVYDKSAEAVKNFTSDFLKYPVRPVELPELAQSDIICTVTPSHTPYLKKELLKKGVHINAVGADAKGKEELDPEILLHAAVVVDDIGQVSDVGEIYAAVNAGKFNVKNIYATLSEIVGGRKTLNRKNMDTTVFISTGVAITDIAIAKMIYNKAIRMNRYSLTNFIDS